MSISSSPDRHYQFPSIYHVDHGTCSLQPLVETPALQQGGGCQDPAVEWTALCLDYQGVGEVSSEILDGWLQPGS